MNSAVFENIPAFIFFSFKDLNGHWPPRLSHSVSGAKKSYLSCDLSLCVMYVWEQWGLQGGDDKPTLLLHSGGEETWRESIRWDSGSLRAVRVGWRCTRALSNDSSEEGKAVLCNAPFHVFSEWQASRDCQDLCQNGISFVPSLLRSLLLSLDYEVRKEQEHSMYYVLWACQEHSTASTVSRKFCNKLQQDEQ